MNHNISLTLKIIFGFRTNTECEIKTSPVSRRVCTFKYLQKDHNVPATNVEVNLSYYLNPMIIIEL